MNQNLRQVFFTTFLLVVSIANTNAAIIYDNGVNTYSAGLYSSGIINTDNFNYQIMADEFTLSSKSVITDLHWTGDYTPYIPLTHPDDFLINIYDNKVTSHDNDNSFERPTDFGTAPIYTFSVSSVNRTLTDIYDATGSRQYKYSALIDPFVAQAGQKYWLSIFNQITDVNWGWQYEDGIGTISGYQESYTYDNVWKTMTDYGALDFQLTGYVVPEPSTFFLLGGGLVGLGFVVRRRRKE